MLCDLNVQYPSTGFDDKPTREQINKLKASLAVLEQLGYTHIALNFVPEAATGQINKKTPSDVGQMNPINIERDFSEFEGRLKLFTRITLKIDDPSQCQNVVKFQQVFDIVAVEPKTERALQLAITNLEVDIITFNYKERLPCYLKHKTIGSATEKGIHFEIKYTDFLESNSRQRAQSIANVKQLIRASRSRGLLCASGLADMDRCRLRSASDITNLLDLIGLDHNRAARCFEDWSMKVLLLGRLRIKSYKQTVAIAGDSSLLDNSLENTDLASKTKGNAKMDVSRYKKRRQQTAVDRQIKRRKE